MKNAIEFQGHRVIFRHGSHLPLYLDGNECFELPPGAAVNVCACCKKDSQEHTWLTFHGIKVVHDSICNHCAIEFGVVAGENKP